LAKTALFQLGLKEQGGGAVPIDARGVGPFKGDFSTPETMSHGWRRPSGEYFRLFSDFFDC
jgi:hypothetical protein